MITTNELRSGTRIKLANGWYGTLVDNKKGNIRDAEVEGFYTEVGSVYSHDIVQALVDGEWMAVAHTPKQIALRKAEGDIFGFHYTDSTDAGL